jgi:hypothetical protein
MTQTDVPLGLRVYSMARAIQRGAGMAWGDRQQGGAVCLSVCLTLIAASSRPRLEWLGQLGRAGGSVCLPRRRQSPPPLWLPQCIFTAHCEVMRVVPNGSRRPRRPELRQRRSGLHAAELVVVATRFPVGSAPGEVPKPFSLRRVCWCSQGHCSTFRMRISDPV